MGIHDTKPDLVLSLVDNYDFYEFGRFLMSLRRTGYSGHVCLFVGPGLSRLTLRKMRQLGVEMIRFDLAFPFIPDPHPLAPKSLPNPIDLTNYRHFLYYNYLRKHEGEFRNVLLTDARDVFFQDDPFGWEISHCMHVAMENPLIRVGACKCTSSWILDGYSPEVLERVKDEELSCAGTTLGPAPLVVRYLELMLDQIALMKDANLCSDQAAHNLLLHDGCLEPTRRLRNFEGPLLTVGTEPSYRLNERNELVNRDGSVIPIIHQYDRHRELVRIFEEKVRPWPLHRFAARTAFRVRNRLRAIRQRRQMRQR